VSLSPAVFLDRDGTMIQDVGYLERMDRLALFPYTLDAIRLFNRAGFKVVVVTSQNGVASGMVTEKFLAELHGSIAMSAEGAGGLIHGFYYCPHNPQAVVEQYRTDCDCRKPKPGMIHAAARDLSLDVSRSFVVGDRWRDIEMGQAAGAKGILVETGYGRTEALNRPDNIEPVPIVANLMEAASLILRKGV
jgi:D-glycero-D-manno-heptose 1,7-bisphosphate phosphatase